MKTQRRTRTYLKDGILMLCLFLAMGLFASIAQPPVFADTTATVTASTLSTPTITAVGSKGYDSVKIIWSAVPGATSYEISYASSASGNYYKAGTATTTSFIKNELTTGKTYYFKVRAVATSDSGTIYGSYSPYKAVTPIPATPVAKAASLSYTSIKVSWAAVPGATAYKIYRGTSATGVFSYRLATASLSYTNTGLTTGKTYYYKVIAYRTVNGVQIVSKTTVVSARPVPVAPTCSVSTKTATKAGISWTGVTGATAYQVLRSETASGTYSLITTVNSSARSYINTGLVTGKTYYYKVRAYHMEGSTKVYGYRSLAKSVKLGSVYGSGVYKVGTDIPAGEYLLVSTGTASFYTSTDAAGNDRIGNGLPKPTLYATLRAGEYATFNSLKIYPIASAPKIGVNADGTFVPGQYKVGRDFPAGDYVIDYQGSTTIGHLRVDSNSLNLTNSIVGADLYRGRIYVTLSAGDYFTFDKGIGYPLAKAPALDKSQPILQDGMYLVGTDIPSGTYTIATLNTEWGYVTVYSDATHKEASKIMSARLTADKKVTVADGQYLYVLAGAFAQLSD